MSPEDNTAITDLMAATRHCTIQIILSLEFKSVTLESLLTSQSTKSEVEKLSKDSQIVNDMCF